MAKLTTKYQVKVPPITINGEEILKLEPIKLASKIGKVIIYPPASKNRKPESYAAPKSGVGEVKLEVGGSSFWDADTLYIDIETEATPDLSREDRFELEREMHVILTRFLKLLRRKLPETPMPLPTTLLPATFFEWEPPQTGQLVASLPTTPSTVMVIPQEAGLTKERWNELQQEITSGAETALWEDFIVDAKNALKEEDLNRAILYAAIACEIFIKEYCQRAAKQAGISQKFWKYLESRRPRVVDYYDSVLHLVKNHSLQAENPEMGKLLRLLWKARKQIVHEGKLSISKDETTQLREAIHEIGQVISWVRGL
jgi:hypothetical protein